MATRRRRKAPPIAEVDASPAPAKKAAAKKTTRRKGKPQDNPGLFVGDLARSLSKKLKDDTLVRQLSDGSMKHKVRDWVPTGFVELDWLISDGRGVPVGRAMEVWGLEQTGKSAMVQWLGAMWQQQTGGILCVIDFEGSVDEDHVEGYGWDWDRVMYSFPETMEQGWNIIWELEKYIKAADEAGTLPGPVLVLWDSVASAPTAEEVSHTADQQTVGGQARVLSRECRKLRRRVAGAPWTILFTNQVRTKIGGGGYGDNKTRPGGKALDFVCDTRLKFTKVKTRSKGSGAERIVQGFEIQVESDKNRFAQPLRRAEWFLSFHPEHPGPDPVESLYATLKDAKIVKPAGKYAKVKLPSGEVTVQGAEGFREIIDEHGDELYDLALSHLRRSDPRAAHSEEDDED